MQIHSVRFQNCFSFGNELTEVRFDKAKTTLVVGKNGGGKSSSILDTLCYGLYGKPYRKLKRLAQMINSITGRDMLVEVDMTVRGHLYTIRRGQKPNLFEVYRDGIMVDQASSVKEQQEWLEKSVLRMDHRAFCQIVVLGSANHVPFMQLPAAQRREVIEDILDIQVFSAMNDVLKEKVSDLKERMIDVDKRLSVARRELEIEEKYEEEARLDQNQKIRDLEDDLISAKTRHVELSETISHHQSVAASLTQTIADSESVLKKKNDLLVGQTKLNQKIALARKELEFFREHENCPTCKQGIQADFREEISAARVAEIEEYQELLKKIEKQGEQVSTRLADIKVVQSEIDQHDREFVRAKSDLNHLDEIIAKLVGDIDRAHETKRDRRGSLDDIRKNVALVSKEKDDLVSEGKVIAAASALLKDGGIKAQIVRQYIPLMNKLVNKYLAALELFVDFNLDEEFNEEIRSRHRDSFSYESFSEGEKLRIDLSILFAWRDIARMRSSSAVDLVIFDEILDGSLDAEGADYFLKLVHEQTEDCRVFIISHREGLEDKFGRTLTFSKRNNFSKMAES